VIKPFTTAGRFSRGFKDVGFEISRAIENFPPKEKPIKLIFPKQWYLLKT